MQRQQCLRQKKRYKENIYQYYQRVISFCMNKKTKWQNSVLEFEKKQVPQYLREYQFSTKTKINISCELKSDYRIQYIEQKHSYWRRNEHKYYQNRSFGIFPKIFDYDWKKSDYIIVKDWKRFRDVIVKEIKWIPRLFFDFFANYAWKNLVFGSAWIGTWDFCWYIFIWSILYDFLNIVKLNWYIVTLFLRW